MAGGELPHKLARGLTLRQAPLLWLPECSSIRRRRGPSQTEVWFRIRHVALDGTDGANTSTYCEQKVEVALVTKGAFKKGKFEWACSASPQKRTEIPAKAPSRLL